MSDEPLVASLSQVTIAYGQYVAAEDVSFDIHAGEYVCLIGRNGSGKSTLMKGMLGLLAPRTGSISIPGGPDSTAFLPQTMVGRLDFPATVWEIAISGRQDTCHLSPFYNRKDREAAMRILASLGIADLAARRIGSLSGGQRQRAFLARCLCRDPRLLLLDEPFAGLDPQASESLVEILEELRATRDISILMSSHDLAVVAARASRVLVLDRRLLFDGDVDQWLERFKSQRLQPCTH